MNRRTHTDKTKEMILTGMFAAVLAVLSQIHIPMPSGVPVTLQTFAIALTGFVLGWKKGLTAVAVYILLGAFGLPVFTGFAGGFGKIAGPTGGFIWGFLFLAAACGAAAGCRALSVSVLAPAVGLLLCHFIGVVQFMAVSECAFGEAVLLVSAPYIIKDAVSAAAAWFLARTVRRRMNIAGITLN